MTTPSNTLPDPSFEGGTPTAGWTVPGGVTFAAATSGGAADGTHYILVTCSGTGSRQITSPVLATDLVPGEFVSVGLQLADMSDSSNVGVGIRFYDIAHAQVGGDHFPARTPVGTGWASDDYRTYDFEIPATADEYKLLISTATGVSGRTFKIDKGLGTLGVYHGVWLDTGESPPDQPNIFMCKTDDGASNLMRYMSEVRRYAAMGTTFVNHYLAVPSCLASRWNAMCGRYPWSTGIIVTDESAGNTAIRAHASYTDTVAIHLKAAGYRTLFVGKPWNGFDPTVSTFSGGRFVVIPPGWDGFWGSSDGKDAFGWTAVTSLDAGVTRTVITADGTVDSFCNRVMLEFILAWHADHVANHPGVPFYIEWDPFTPHGVAGTDPEGDDFSADPLDREYNAGSWPAGWPMPTYPANGNCGDPDNDGGCQVIILPDPNTASPRFNVRPINPPGWMATGVVGPSGLAACLEDHIERIQGVQSVDRGMIAINAAIEAAGQTSATVFAATTDNGYHLADHAIRDGKAGPYNEDTSVTLVIVPPGGSDALTSSAWVQPTDYGPTWFDFAGFALPSTYEGLSLRPYLEETTPATERAFAASQFDPGSGTWESHLGTDNPFIWRAWYGPFGTMVDDSAFNDTAPDDTRGQMYGPDDPYQMNNRWLEVDGATRDTINTRMQALMAATGSAVLPLMAVPLTVELDGGTEGFGMWSAAVRPGWQAKLIGADMSGNEHRWHTTEERVQANVYPPAGANWGDGTEITITLRDTAVDDPQDPIPLTATVVGTPGPTTVVQTEPTLIGEGEAVWRCMVAIDKGSTHAVINAGLIVIHVDTDAL